jgi:predicted ester cyclase
MVFFSAFSDIQAIVEDQIAEGDKVANRITMHCTQSGEYSGHSCHWKADCDRLHRHRPDESWKDN